jgi:hypothetical protein
MPHIRLGNRITELRATTLDERDRGVLKCVEQFGWSVTSVRSSNGVPGWSYTTGICDLSEKPEIVVVGLDGDLAHSVLNDIALRMSKGLDVRDGQRLPGLLANVECEFRTVEQRWVAHIMGWSNWFNGNSDYPVLQCVYPDLAGRFPWEENFEKSWRARQPLLFEGVSQTSTERWFWEANEKNSVFDGWKFPVSPHTGVFTTKKINRQEEPITYVSHDADDGAWQFHGPSDSPTEEAVVVCFHHITDHDPSIRELFDLQTGWCAWRDEVGAPWHREPRES